MSDDGHTDPADQSGPLIEPIADDEVDAFWRASSAPFGEDVDPDELAFHRALTEVDRTFAARDGSQMVAMGAAQSLDVSLPGGTVAPMAGVSMLAVLPTHRRHGLGRAVLHRLHAQARERGEALAGLWASEGGIYGNYGYGVGARMAVVTVSDRVVWRDIPDDRPTLRLVDVDTAVTTAQALIGRARTRVAGIPWLSEERLRRHLFHDPPGWREGAGPRAFVAVDGGRGLASYRVTVEWHPTGPVGTVRADWLIADDRAAEACLWQYLTEMDLVTSARIFGRPADDPVELLAADARTVDLTVADGLWLRVLNPAAALSMRRYAADGRLVVEVVDDDGFASGRFDLTVEAGVGECAPARRGSLPDVTMPAGSLAAAALGDDRPTRRGRAGLADEHTPGGLWLADRMLAVERAPWCPFVIE